VLLFPKRIIMWGALSDTRTGLSLTTAAGFASAVFLVFESRGTRDHILLFTWQQIWEYQNSSLSPPWEPQSDIILIQSEICIANKLFCVFDLNRKEMAEEIKLRNICSENGGNFLERNFVYNTEIFKCMSGISELPAVMRNKREVSTNSCYSR
jgi:hypothetical protein